MTRIPLRVQLRDEVDANGVVVADLADDGTTDPTDDMAAAWTVLEALVRGDDDALQVMLDTDACAPRLVLNAARCGATALREFMRLQGGDAAAAIARFRRTLLDDPTDPQTA